MKLLNKIANYLEKRRALEKIQLNKQVFDNEKRTIVKLLLEDKPSQDSIKLFNAISQEYFEEMKSKNAKLKKEEAMVHHHLAKNYKL